MARVIKAGVGHATPQTSTPPRFDVAVGNRKVISHDVIRAREQATELIAQAKRDADHRRAEGRKRAAQIHEAALAEGAQEAYTDAALEVIDAFWARAQQLQTATEDIRALADEIVQKIMGVNLSVAPREQTQIITDGLRSLREKRKLQFAHNPAAHAALHRETPALAKAIFAQPDFVIVVDDSVADGFVRVSSDAGPALSIAAPVWHKLADILRVVPTKAAAPLPATRPDVPGLTTRQEPSGDAQPMPAPRVFRSK